MGLRISACAAMCVVNIWRLTNLIISNELPAERRRGTIFSRAMLAGCSQSIYSREDKGTRESSCLDEVADADGDVEYDD